MNKEKLVNLFHIFAVAPLFWALGQNKLSMDLEKNLVFVAAGLLLWHGYRFWKLYEQDKIQKFISLVHILIVAPALWLISQNRFPAEYRKYLVYAAVAVALLHVLKFTGVLSNSEGMEGGMAHNIKVFDSSPGFSHPILTITSGDIVIWTNIGELEHRLLSTDKQTFNSGGMKPGDTFSVQFNKPGVFDYHCITHKGWQLGKIIVEEPPKKN